jgi:hypothetical protein
MASPTAATAAATLASSAWMAATIMRVLRVSIAAVAGLTDSVIEDMVTLCSSLSLKCASMACKRLFSLRQHGVSVFALVKRKNRNTKEHKVPLRQIRSEPLRKSVHDPPQSRFVVAARLAR